MKKKDIPDRILKDFVSASREVGRRGLTRCSSGNLSMRLDDERMLITASRSWKGELTPGQICVCRISDGKALDGKNPSVEAGFHAGILRARPDMRVVLHFQSPCATTLACIPRKNINYFMTPEIPFYIGSIARVPFILPGSKDLANAVTTAMRHPTFRTSPIHHIWQQHGGQSSRFAVLMKRAAEQELQSRIDACTTAAFRGGRTRNHSLTRGRRRFGEASPSML